MYRTAAGKAADPNVSDPTKPVELIVRPRGKPLKDIPKETYALPTDSCADVYDRIAAKARCSIHRIRITKGSDGSLVPNTKDTTIDEMGLYEQSSLSVKDLGPQIEWRTVFLIEYLGPMLIHPLLFFLRPYIYHSLIPPTQAQILSFLFITAHFMKREFETLWVHRFSAATMPALNIVKNSAHYWLLAGLNIALCTYSPGLGCPTARSPPYSWWNGVAAVLFLLGEVGNLSAHLTLRGLRSEGGKERGIPNSGLFRLVPVTCPNYFFETVAWAGIWMVNRSWSTGLFVAVAVVQMALWARKKEARYRREFGSSYGKKRFAMIPGII